MHLYIYIYTFKSKSCYISFLDFRVYQFLTQREQRERLTVVAVFIFGPVDGSVWQHLQVEALLAEEPGHYPLQLRL